MSIHLAKEERFDPYRFVKYIRVIGRAYQRQAIELIMISRLFLEYLQPFELDVTCDKPLFSLLFHK